MLQLLFGPFFFILNLRNSPSMLLHLQGDLAMASIFKVGS